MKILVRIKKCLILAAILLSQKYDDSNQLVVDKMEDETGGVVIKEFVGLKPKKKMDLFLVGDRSKHKKTRRVNKNGECKDVLTDCMFLSCHIGISE